MNWLGTNHELSKSGDSIKRKHVHELKRIFQILLDHQGLKVLGTVNVIVDEVCGEGTWIKYSERSERWRKGEEERERIKLERLRKEEEARYKDFDEKLEEWKSGEINFLNTPFYIPGEKPNAWIRIKGNIIETSKQIKIGIAEARKLWRAVSAMHRGAEFRHLPSPRRGIGPVLRTARPSRGTWSSPVASRAPATSTSETWFGR